MQPKQERPEQRNVLRKKNINDERVFAIEGIPGRLFNTI